MVRLHTRAWASIAGGSAIVGALLLVWGCGIYDSSLLLPAPPDAALPVDAGPEADAGADAGSGCELAQWPRRPPNDDVPGGGTIEIINAVRSVDYGLDREGGVPRDFGFDLDGVCTCPLPDFVESCRVPADKEPHCDLADGRDNSVAGLLQTFTKFSSAFSQTSINDDLESGHYGLLLRIRSYNGTANDPSVEIAAFNSAGNEGAEDGGTPARPRNDGTDEWTLVPESLKGGIGPPFQPVYVDVNAYVSNYRLVATIDFPLTLGSIGGKATVTVDLKASVVVGTLVAEGSSFRIDDGTVSGRWPVARLLTSLEVLPDPGDPTKFLCGDSPSYAAVKELVCSGQDIVSDVKQDNTGAPCDAVSISIGFTSGPARLGKVVAPPPTVKPCGPQWTDDCAR